MLFKSKKKEGKSVGFILFLIKQTTKVILVPYVCKCGVFKVWRIREHMMKQDKTQASNIRRVLRIWLTKADFNKKNFSL